MVHMKTQMDLLTKHLLSKKTKKVKAIGSQSRAEFDSGEEANYLTNQGDSNTIAKGIKVRIIMISLDIRIRSKEIEGQIMIEPSYMSLLKIMRLL